MGPPLVIRQVSNLLVVHFIGRLSLETKPRPKRWPALSIVWRRLNIDRWLSDVPGNRRPEAVVLCVLRRLRHPVPHTLTLPAALHHLPMLAALPGSRTPRSLRNDRCSLTVCLALCGPEPPELQRQWSFQPAQKLLQLVRGQMVRLRRIAVQRRSMQHEKCLKMRNRIWIKLHTLAPYVTCSCV